MRMLDKTAIRLVALGRWAWALLGGILVVAAAMLLLAPAEATIGEGIRIVYVHVALIWAGMLLLLLAGILGLIVLLGGRPAPAVWMQLFSWAGLGFFAAGVITSLAAEIVNWGGIAWREPRTAANLNLLALAVIVRVVSSWLTRPRVKGLLNVVLALAVIWTTITTELQLHPANAIGDATSQTIQLTFYALFLLSCLAAAWFILYARGQQLVRARQGSALPGSVGNDRSGRSSKAGS